MSSVRNNVNFGGNQYNAEYQNFGGNQYNAQQQYVEAADMPRHIDQLLENLHSAGLSQPVTESVATDLTHAKRAAEAGDKGKLRQLLENAASNAAGTIIGTAILGAITLIPGT